jgi:hypothetical protein
MSTTKTTESYFGNVHNVDEFLEFLKMIKAKHGGKVPLYIQTFRSDETDKKRTFEGVNYVGVNSLSNSTQSPAMVLSSLKDPMNADVPVAVTLFIT